MRRSVYDASEIEAFAVYCAEIRQCYFVPIAELDGQYHLQLRLRATRNNQASRIRWARDYEFAAKLHSLLGP